MKTDKLVLDACCGGRMFWFNKQHPETIYVDNRIAEKGHIDYKGCGTHKVIPDVMMDFRSLNFSDKKFKLIVFDPPHLTTLTETSLLRKKYGCLNKETWQSDLKKGFDECWRVLDNHGTLVFKWSETEIPLKKVLSCFSQKPLFGHPTMHGKTIWCVFFKSK